MPGGHPDPDVLRPLTPMTRSVLASLERGPTPCREINHGVSDRLLRGKLVEQVDLPSPYRTVKGSVPHLRILPAGIAELRGNDHQSGVCPCPKCSPR